MDTAQPQWEVALGNIMFHLNIVAVNACYGEGKARCFRALDYQYKAKSASKIQVFKSLRCWLYQCKEGDVYKHHLYQAFETVILDYLMTQIITEMPEYRNAEWG
jgi:hypothetical protein